MTQINDDEMHRISMGLIVYVSKRLIDHAKSIGKPLDSKIYYLEDDLSTALCDKKSDKRYVFNISENGRKMLKLIICRYMELITVGDTIGDNILSDLREKISNSKHNNLLSYILNVALVYENVIDDGRISNKVTNLNIYISTVLRESLMRRKIDVPENFDILCATITNFLLNMMLYSASQGMVKILTGKLCIQFNQEHMYNFIAYGKLIYNINLDETGYKSLHR